MPQPTITEVAALVLKDAARPLHVREILKAVDDRSLYPWGPTPDRLGVLARKIREKTVQDPGCIVPVFRKLAPNTFALSEWGAGSDVGEEAYQAEVNELSAEDSDSSETTPERRLSARNGWYRDPRVASRALRKAHHLCEAACGRPLFDRRGSSGSPYVEAHHLIPLSAQDQFARSLDVVQNIVALCPWCHAVVHQAADAIRSPLIRLLFASRKATLRSRGFALDDNELLQLYEIDS